MNKGLKNKGLGSWFCLAAALVALITGIVFLLTQATAAPLGHSGTMAGVVLLVGAAASLVFFFVSVPFSALIQAVIYNIALYLVVVQLYFVFADVINHVTFAGGNAGLCVFYMIGTFIACLLSVIACFCKQTKTGEAKATGKQFAAAGAVVAVAAVCVGGFSLQSSSLPSADNAEVAPDAAQTSADGPVMNYNDNEYVSKTLDDLIAIPQETWEAKEPNGEVAYFFEGQYTEGFSTIVDPACLDMYCYTDGSMWGSFSGPSTSVGGDSISHVYGYWYNHDENGEKNFVIHLLGNQDADGTVRPTDVDPCRWDVSDIQFLSELHSWCTSFSFDVQSITGISPSKCRGSQTYSARDVFILLHCQGIFPIKAISRRWNNQRCFSKARNPTHSLSHISAVITRLGIQRSASVR